MKIFSIINSFNVYQYNPENPEQDTVSVLGGKYPKITDARNGKILYAKPLPPEYLCELESDLGKKRWFALIRDFPKVENYVRACDIVDLSGNAFERNYVLLFPFERDMNSFKPMSGLLANTALSARAGREADVRENTAIVRGLAEAWGELDSAGYLYHEFSPDNLFYGGGGGSKEVRVKLDFSFSAHRYGNLNDGLPVPANRLSPDYTDGYYYLRKSHKQDVISNYFSMAVILFRLLVGLLPYQGRLLEGVHNITKQEHSEWIKKYHQNPIFIFDENENVNRISSTTAYPEIYVKRWESLSPQLREMFAAVFARKNALRTVPPVFFTPREWALIINN